MHSENPTSASKASQPLALVISVGSDNYLQNLATQASQSLAESGYHVEHIDLCEIGYSPAMPEADRRAYHSEQPIIDPLVRAHADLVLAAKVITFVYPVIWGTLPALLKGWLDRTFVIGVALILVNGKVRRNLTGVNHVVGIAVSHAQTSIEGKVFRDRGKRLITRTIPIITKRRAKKHYLHHTRQDDARGVGGNSDSPSRHNASSFDSDFTSQVSATLKNL